MAGARLLVDIGGTHARLALQPGPDAAPGPSHTYACAAFPGVLELLQHHLRQHADTPPTACGIGIASPVLGDRVVMTNLPWAFSVAGLNPASGA